jgi:response regulator RpfG family c-di-GMP phosphodiesterase
MIIRYQHEHVDGTGYFEGLDAEKIPLRSRILAVANAFDEMISTLNPAFVLTDDQAADSLRKRSGTELDPNVVEAFLKTRSREPNIHPAALSMNEGTRNVVSAGL